MSSGSTTSLTRLFVEWRRNDNGDAGQQLAQSVANWYYALATSFAGEMTGAGVAERASAEFGRGISTVRDEDELIPWAHSLIVAKLLETGAPAKGGHHPSVYSNARPPIDLLLFAKRELPQDVHLLELCYVAECSAADLQRVAVSAGGYPFAIVEARYRVKKLLKNRLNAPFTVIHDDVPRDLIPLPLYEAGRLKTRKERDTFEQWILENPSICSDIAEFAPYAIALRQQLPNTPPPASLIPVDSPVSTQSFPSEEATDVESPIVPEQSAAFLLERPLGLPAPERPGRRRFRPNAGKDTTLRVKVTVGLIAFCLTLAFGLLLVSP